MRAETAPKRIYRRLVCLAAAVCLGLTGCSDGVRDSHTIKTSDDTACFRRYYSDECTTLNYLVTNKYNDTAVSANIVDCLVDHSSRGEILPGLAESWSSNEDMTEWTFRIRKGVKWVDYLGREYAEVKADDWVAAAQYINDAANGSTSQYMYTSGARIHSAEEYHEYTKYMVDSAGGRRTVSPDGRELTEPPAAAAEDIGVKAPDDYTLVYTLDMPCPFFLSILSYPSYMPVCRKYLEERGDMFGRDNKNLLYNGAFILSTWQPLDKRVLTKNKSYWDVGNVFLDSIEEIYNPDAYKMQADMYLKGEVDEAQIEPGDLKEWLADKELSKLVHPERKDNSYSYFYCFNFDPHFDEKYDPVNWRKAAANENFRRAVACALDKKALVSVYDPYEPEQYLSDTITPRDFVRADDRDYTETEPLARAQGELHADKAEGYAEAAKKQLKAAGAAFPIKILMPYNPNVIGWKQETELAEKQLETALGKEFVDVIPEAGSEIDFLGEVRQRGRYALMKCNWGSDYIDPETFTDPFRAGCDFNFWDKADGAVGELFGDWDELRAKAASVTETAERYSLFARAESLLISHAIVIPFSIECTGGYIVSRLDQYEREYSPSGIASQRFKFMHLYKTSYGMEENARRRGE